MQNQGVTYNSRMFNLVQFDIMQKIPDGNLPLPDNSCSVCGSLIPEWDEELPTPDLSTWLHHYREGNTSPSLGSNISDAATCRTDENH